MEKKIDVKDLKEDVATLLEKSTELTERVEALEKPVSAQNSGSACQENRIQIELLQPHGKENFAPSYRYIFWPDINHACDFV